MKTSYKILLYLLGFLLISFIIFLIVRGIVSKPSQNNQNGQTSQQNLPDYILGSQDEAKVKEFVKNFINLYNTYRYQDFTNLTALGDYQTVSFQQRTQDLVNQLQNQVPEGFEMVTSADAGSFSYKYPSANFLQVSMKASVEEKSGQAPPEFVSPRVAPSASNYQILVTVELSPSGKTWLVNDIKIQKLK